MNIRDLDMVNRYKKCPKCGGRKPYLMACIDCGYSYLQYRKPKIKKSVRDTTSVQGQDYLQHRKSKIKKNSPQNNKNESSDVTKCPKCLSLVTQSNLAKHIRREHENVKFKRKFADSSLFPESVI